LVVVVEIVVIEVVVEVEVAFSGGTSGMLRMDAVLLVVVVVVVVGEVVVVADDRWGPAVFLNSGGSRSGSSCW
jgi:hypothetical protein